MRSFQCSSVSSVRISRSCPELEVGRRVMEGLWASNLPGLRRVAIDVHHDTVTLRGEVASYYERQMAIARTAGVSGVSRVVDMLVVR